MMFFGHMGIGDSTGPDRNVSAHGRLFTAALTLTGAFLGISICNSWAIPQTLAGPRMVGRWVGVQNFAGNLAGAVAPALTGLLLDPNPGPAFHWPFFYYRRGGLDRQGSAGGSWSAPSTKWTGRRHSDPGALSHANFSCGGRGAAVIHSCHAARNRNQVSSKRSAGAWAALYGQRQIRGWLRHVPTRMNTLYDLPGGVLRARKQLLRLRKYGVDVDIDP